MNSVDTGHLIYLIVLGVAVVGWFLASNRLGLNRTLQYAAVWGLIFLGAIAAVGLWGDIQRTASPFQTQNSTGDAITVPRSFDGHYYLSLIVNDTPLTFVVDTGATDIVLTQADAARAGIDTGALRYMGRAMTANGPVETATVRLDEISLGPITDSNVAAVVNGGEMGTSLLGMGYLQRFASIEISNGTLTLRR